MINDSEINIYDRDVMLFSVKVFYIDDVIRLLLLSFTR